MTSPPPFLLARRSLAAPAPSSDAVTANFLDRSIQRLSRIVQSGYADWELASRDGWLHRLDPRVKVVAAASLLIVVSVKRTVLPEAGIALFVLGVFLTAGVDVRRIYARVLTAGLVFGLLVPFPALFNLVSEGQPLFTVARFSGSHDLWGYAIPQTITVTREGLHAVAMLFFRVTNSVALTLLLAHTTPFADVARTLRLFRVPDAFVVVIALSCKYLFLFARTVEEMHLAKKSRLLGPVRARDARHWVAERMTFLYRKTQMRYEEILKVMLARGFTGEVKLYGLPALRAVDWSAAAAALLAALALVWW